MAWGAALSAVAASAFPPLPQAHRRRLLSAPVSFAVGALLGAAFPDLLPGALESRARDRSVRWERVVLLGPLGFCLLEKLVLWRNGNSRSAKCRAALASTHPEKRERPRRAQRRQCGTRMPV